MICLQKITLEKHLNTKIKLIHNKAISKGLNVIKNIIQGKTKFEGSHKIKKYYLIHDIEQVKIKLP